METAIITVLIMVSAIGVGIYIDKLTSKLRELNNRVISIDKDIDTMQVDLRVIESQNRSIINNTSYMEESIRKIHEYIVPKRKVVEVPLKNAQRLGLKDSLFVVEHEDYMHLCTKDGYILPCNISVSVTDNVNEPLTATASFHVKKGRIVK